MISGGEQQMVAIARALVSKPKLLMLDEPSIGLSPNVLADVFEKIVEVNRTQGVTILIVEQKVRKVLAITDHVYSLKLGKVAFSGPAAPLADNKAKLKELFLEHDSRKTDDGMIACFVSETTGTVYVTGPV